MDNYTEDKDILKQIVANDTATIKLVYKDNYPIIQNFILSNNGDSDEAKDIFQEALIVLYQNAQLPTFELSCKISTYLYAVSRRLWLKRLQQQSKKSPLKETVEQNIAVEDDVEMHETQNIQLTNMHSALSKLGEPCKSLLEAYYFNKQHMNTIAETFGYTNADNAKNQKYKCLLRLKKMFFATYKNN